LRVSIVHHLVEKLIDDDEVVPDGLFLDIFEVAFEDIDESMEEGEDKDGIIILFGDGDKVEVVVFVEVEEVVVLVLYEGPI
jgi:hypothetical protein